jgi:septal ring factor EnvC (AmiA/AmiB activator)
MLENEVQELTTQLRKARQDIFGLIEMHATEAKECAKLRAELKQVKADLSHKEQELVSLKMNSNYLLSSKDKLISEYHRQLNELMGGKLAPPTQNRV